MTSTTPENAPGSPPESPRNPLLDSLKHKLAEISKLRGDRFPSHIRRCFMTGKQCTMHSVGREGATSAGAPDSVVPVFVAMPFRHNLSTFYEWSLRPYLCEHLGVPDGWIRRADEFRNVGYVTCEKICRRIQEAKIIVVDISTPNANVYYELGLAVGLGRTLLIFCEENSPYYKNPDYAQALGLDHSKIIKYPSLGVLKTPDAIEKLQSVMLGKRKVLASPEGAAGQSAVPTKPKLLIRPLLAPGAEHVPSRGAAPYDEDIPVPFGTAVTSAIGVAINSVYQNPDVRRTLHAIECTEAMETAAAATPIKLYGERNTGEAEHSDLYRYAAFSETARQVDEVFALVVDLGVENPFSYYWLGYCHARGINAIPVHRPAPVKPQPSRAEAGPVQSETSEKHSPNGQQREDRQGVLAFDIRALWYIPYYSDDRPTVLATSLVSALTELLPRDLGTLQRGLFWERLTSRRKISIFTGAVHHATLNREVVGDWDQRTVSELVRYLSQAGETVVTVLEKPVYAPETVCQKLADAGWAASIGDNAAILKEYLELVRDELSNHPDCVIVGSADVNPMTEVVLARAYNLVADDVCFRQNDALPEHHAVVALKSTGKPESKDPPRCFSRDIPERLQTGRRGFMWGQEAYGADYLSQDNASKLVIEPKTVGSVGLEGPTPSALLGHIAVLPNPFADAGGTIVVLNGVSGPATFGLAEMLTGGAEDATAEQSKKKADAETMVAKLNSMWSAGDGFHGVEGLVRVEMGAMSTSAGSDAKRKVRAMFYDQRDVSTWSWYSPEKHMAERPKNKPMNRGNPRVIDQS